MSAGSARPDHYATLGVAPGASAAEVRAAYLALLREHHPDRNSSPEAVDRTKAIITAFKVIGDFDQRSYYDWDRRRDREAAEAAAAAVPRRRSRAALAAGGIGLAAVGAWLLLPNTDTSPPTDTPRTAAVEVEREEAPPVRTASARPPAERSSPEPTIVRTPALAEVAKDPPAERVVKSDPPRPVERIASAKPSPPPPERTVKEPKVPAPVRVAARTTPVKAAPARSATDIAQLDQFVMGFYGQSWRYGDAPKRAVLEKTKAGFVARRGACSGDTCRRNAYLDLMRDVSSIVETGKPEMR